MYFENKNQINIQFSDLFFLANEYYKKIKYINNTFDNKFI